MKARALAAILACCLLPLAARADDPFAAPGKYQVSAATYDWKDAPRDRPVPAKIYFPKDLPAAATCPIIIFSHGLGGSREGYAYLGQQWASHGYVSIHLTHVGSDTALLKGNLDRPMQAMQRAAMNPDNMRNRPADVSFAIDQLASLNTDDPALKSHLDLKSIGVAGHSFGGYTTMAIAGQDYSILGKFADPRVTCAIAMSAPAPMLPRQVEKAYAKITIPMLIMTGTLDDSPIGGTLAADRKAPLEHMTSADRFLLIFDGGDHMVFAGARGMRVATGLPGTKGDTTKDARFQELIKASTTAFWDANLKHDKPAQTYLTAEFPKALAKYGTWDHREKGQ